LALANQLQIGDGVMGVRHGRVVTNVVRALVLPFARLRSGMICLSHIPGNRIGMAKNKPFLSASDETFICRNAVS
jgi:hypothetical protein